MDLTLFDEAVGRPNVAGAIDVPPAFPLESRDDLLDVATAITLCDGPVEEVFKSLNEMSEELMTLIMMTGESERRLITPALLALHQKIESRKKMREDLMEERKDRRKILRKIEDLESEIRVLHLQLEDLRAAAQQRLLEAEVESVDNDRQRAFDLLGSDAKKINDAQAEQWNKTESQRKQRAVELRKQLQDAATIASERQKRADALSSKMITRTVAGYLVWLGYASVIATGTVLAMLLGRKPGIPTEGVLSTIQAFLDDLPFATNALTRFAVLIGILTVFGLATFGIALLCDRFLRRFDDDWEAGEGEERPVIQLAPSGITRRSYTRLLAITPFVFALGACAAFVASVPASKSGKDVLSSLVPTVANTFIGSAIALLATAAFMLYALHIIEARGKGEPRHAWEVAVLPAILILAVGLAVANPMVRDVDGSSTVVWWERIAWGGWALFMLVTSLALAYGLVYHGIYKDETKANERVQRLQWLIQQCEFPPRPVSASLRTWRGGSLEFSYARGRLQQETILRRFRTARTLGLKIEPKPAPKSWQFWRTTSQNGNGSYNGFHPMDSRLASELVKNIEERRRSSNELMSERSELDRSIVEKENLCGLVQLEQLRDELAEKLGRVQSSEANDLQRQASANFAKADLVLRVRGAITTAKAMSQRIDPKLGPQGPQTPSR
ncbi:MAG TPA: hypothetical protein VNA69_10745 [Thermoanaerobaculia bacterium]|nr:hypothetical protein [Thermoanaerobaculia bacterium]